MDKVQEHRRHKDGHCRALITMSTVNLGYILSVNLNPSSSYIHSFHSASQLHSFTIHSFPFHWQHVYFKLQGSHWVQHTQTLFIALICSFSTKPSCCYPHTSTSYSTFCLGHIPVYSHRQVAKATCHHDIITSHDPSYTTTIYHHGIW